MKAFLLTLLLGSCQLLLGQNITDVPICAQTCLANATNAQTACTGIDVKCLCTNSAYVNALSCCLATSCAPSDQGRAIAFNIATCNSVNESAPNFVGCSPGVSSFSVPSDDTATLTSQTTTSSTSTATTNPLVTTISGAVESALTSFIGKNPITATLDGRPLLTGTCAQPYFAQATDSTGMITEFPQIGCSHNLEGCCPFDSHENAVLTRCPQDYSTIASACCPSGWQIYFTDIGGQTPCFTRPTITHVPATTSTVARLSVITEHVFTRKYDLSDGAIRGSKSLGSGAIAGIAVGAVAGLGVMGALILFHLRRRKAQKAPQTLATFGGGEGEMVLASPATATAELASPHTLPNSPGSGRNAWISPSSPPAYEHNVDAFRAKARTVAQELPGSTFIFEHHPAYSGQEDQSVTVAPSSPPRTPGRTPPASPHAKSTSSPQVVSPLGSPLQR